MNVENAIKKVERKQMKAQETAEKYLKKGQEMEYLSVECEAEAEGDKKAEYEAWRVKNKSDRYYQKHVTARMYAEELEEVIEVLKHKDRDEKVLFVNEERFENEYSLYGDNEGEWGNTIASMVKCELNNTNVIVICIKKL